MQSVDFDEMAFRPNSLDEILGDCLFVLDTNCLINLWVYGSIPSDELGVDLMNVLQGAAQTNRLLLPRPVIVEFRKNVHKQFGEALMHLEEARSRLSNVFSKDETRAFRSLGRPEIGEVLKKLDARKEELEKLYEYPGITEESVGLLRSAEWWEFGEEEAAEIEETAKRRLDEGLPPGLGDKKKPDGGVGDPIIWLCILEIGKTKRRDVVFVTDDCKKGDWYHVAGKRVICARRELVEEFARASGGSTFGAILLKQFIEDVVPALMPEGQRPGERELQEAAEIVTTTAPPEPEVEGGALPRDALFVPGTQYMSGHHVWAVAVAWAGRGAMVTEPFEVSGPSAIEWDKLEGRSENLRIAVCACEGSDVVLGVPVDRNEDRRSGSADFLPDGPVCLKIEPAAANLAWRASVHQFMGQ